MSFHHYKCLPLLLPNARMIAMGMQLFHRHNPHSIRRSLTLALFVILLQISGLVVDGVPPRPFFFSAEQTTTTASSFYYVKNSVINEPNNRNDIGYIRKSDLPQGNWMSLSESLEFLPTRTTTTMISPSDESVLLQRAMAQFGKPSRKNRGKVNIDHRRRSTRKLEEKEEEQTDETANVREEDTPQYRVQPFVEGVSDYDEYQQAWRLMGFMIDCNDFSYYDAENNNNNNNHGSNDQNDTGEGCARYVIWAAYVDLQYQGGGLGEYQFYDRSTNSWDKTTCMYDTNGANARCAKMDCHLSDTHWSLLGFFKHKDYDDWMEQLFKHEGICVWTDEEYSFMKNARKGWPQGCVLSSTTTSSGDAIYYDLKPSHGAEITMGLYTDARCVKEYVRQGKNDPINIENVIGNILANAGSGDRNKDNNNNQANVQYDSLEESLEAWRSAFSIFKICQPCIAHDIRNVGYNYDDDNMHGSNYGKYTYGYDDDYAYYYKKYQGADFDCYDDADYTNVNQCMKFMAKTTMKSATFRDLAVANAQGTLVDSPMSGYRVQRKHRQTFFGTYFFFAVSTLFFIASAFRFRRVRKEALLAPTSFNPKEPLIFA